MEWRQLLQSSHQSDFQHCNFPWFPKRPLIYLFGEEIGFKRQLFATPDPWTHTHDPKCPKNMVVKSQSLLSASINQQSTNQSYWDNDDLFHC